jgi:predicted amidohydrolase YtcJ
MKRRMRKRARGASTRSTRPHHSRVGLRSPGNRECASIRSFRSRLASDAATVEREGRGNEWWRWPALKELADGSLGSRTALFREAYIDGSDTGTYAFGSLRIAPDYLADIVVIDHDLTKVASGDIQKARILTASVAGQPRYET